MRLSLLKELGLKPTENEVEIEDDPYLILGYGVNAYMEVLIAFLKMYLTLMVASIPFYLVYSHGNAYGAGTGMNSQAITQFFLGNLGSSSMFCD